MNIYEKMAVLQTSFKAPKTEYNSHGGFKYRTLEKMTETLKPLLENQKVLMYFTDGLSECAETPHVTATVTFVNLEKPDEIFSVTASAQEASIQKGMQAAQISGSTSSYARKYALAGALLVDDTDEIDKKEGDQTDWESEINLAKNLKSLVGLFERMSPKEKTNYADLLSVKKKELADATTGNSNQR